MYKKKRKRKESMNGEPPKKKKKFNCPSFKKAPSLTQALVAFNNNKIENKSRVLTNKTNNLNGNDNRLHKPGKKKKFRPPGISNIKVFEEAFQIKAEEFAAAYSNCILGLVKPRPVCAVHDPDDEKAIVLYAPNEEEKNDDELKDKNESDSDSDDENDKIKINIKKKKDKKKEKKRVQVHVVVDPRIGLKLRSHQIDGVHFLYQCLMGWKHEYGNGCILADGMGLGKTLQAITVMWTLLEQGIWFNEPTCKNGVVVSPASLVKNWDNEIKHWLGNKSGKTITTYPCLGKATDTINKWLSCRDNLKGCLIISYESFRSNVKLINRKQVGFIICDEGHKLKNYKSQLSKALCQINTQKRVILTGTPIQNNLEEMYSLVKFINPNCWSNIEEFRNYARKIVRSLDSSAKDKIKQSGQESTNAVRKILNKFLLQRTSKVVMKYLPKKSEYVVFCKLGELQKSLYQKFLHSKTVLQAKNALSESAQNGKGMSAIGFLACGVLCKICNHPSLIYDAAAKIAGIQRNVIQLNNKNTVNVKRRTSPRKKKKRNTKRNTKSENIESEYDKNGNRIRTELEGLYELYPNNFNKTALNYKYSNKIKFVMNMLFQLKQRTKEKVVIVSVYTETLYVLGEILSKNKIGYLKLDGSIPTKKRQVIVDDFNDPTTPYMVLLLSNRAGGCGLNLIGASRLIMFDPDWNPANDAQAMARVWRSGQKRPTFIYRLFSTGTIEEKIFQRQTFKSDMAEQIICNDEDITDMTEFVVKELKRIFIYNDKTMCDTLDRTGNKGFIGWDKHSQTSNVGDPFLTQSSKGIVTYLLKKIVNDPNNKNNSNNNSDSDNESTNKSDENEQKNESFSDDEYSANNEDDTYSDY